MDDHVPSSNVVINIEEKYSKLREELKRDFEFHVSRLEDKITAKNSNISELAMTKVLHVVGLLGTALVGVFGLLAYFGTDDVRTTLIDYSTKKIDQWMSYENVESPLIKNVSDIKDRYLIDSVYIRLQRARAEGHGSRDFSLSDKEKTDLIRIANSPNTASTDYSTIMTILSSRFDFGIPHIWFDRGGIVFANVFSEEYFNDKLEKRRALLQTFSYDTSLGDLARQILLKDDPYFKEEAFNILANIRDPFAITYANGNITPEHIDDIDHRMALVLADRDVESEMLERYITFLKGNPESNGLWLHKIFDLFDQLHHISDGSFSTYEPKKITEKQKAIALDLLIYLIDRGYGFYVSDFVDPELHFGKRPYLSTTPERSEVESLLKDNDFLHKLIMAKSDFPWIAKVVKAFEISHKEKVFVSINLELFGRAALISEVGATIGAGDVIGDIWLTQSVDNPGISAVFRDNTGSIQRVQLKNISHLHDAKFSFKYLQKDLDLIAQYENPF